MSDENQMTGSVVTDDSSGVVTGSSLVVTDDVAERFGELVEMIKKSDSMNGEERQYWVDVLPVMTEEQTENLRHILKSEREQIEAVNSDYDEGVKEDVKMFNLQFDSAKYNEKKKVWRAMEKKHELEEKAHEEALLKEIENMQI